MDLVMDLDFPSWVMPKSVLASSPIPMPKVVVILISTLYSAKLWRRRSAPFVQFEQKLTAVVEETLCVPTGGVINAGVVFCRLHPGPTKFHKDLVQGQLANYEWPVARFGHWPYLPPTSWLMERHFLTNKNSTTSGIKKLTPRWCIVKRHQTQTSSKPCVQCLALNDSTLWLQNVVLQITINNKYS